MVKNISLSGNRKYYQKLKKKIMNLKIGKVNINQNSCTIIVEAGVNHNCSLLMAEKLIKEAKKGGADIIKFQTYKAEKLCNKKITEILEMG